MKYNLMFLLNMISMQNACQMNDAQQTEASHRFDVQQNHFSPRNDVQQTHINHRNDAQQTHASRRNDVQQNDTRMIVVGRTCINCTTVVGEFYEQKPYICRTAVAQQ